MSQRERLARARHIIGIVANAILVLTAVAFVAQPTSAPRQFIRAKLDVQARKRAIVKLWPEMANGAAINGTAHARKIVVFSDYECPACNKFFREGLAEFILAYPDVGIVYRHLPLTRIHPRARDAAKSAICAEQQGSLRAYSQILFDSTVLTSTRAWTEAARLSSIPDTAAFARCLHSAFSEAGLARDSTFAAAAKLRGTPTILFSDGASISGAVSAQTIANQLSRTRSGGR